MTSVPDWYRKRKVKVKLISFELDHKDIKNKYNKGAHMILHFPSPCLKTMLDMVP